MAPSPGLAKRIGRFVSDDAPLFGRPVVASIPRERVKSTPDRAASPRELGSYRWAVVGVSTSVNALAWGARATFALFYVAMLGEFAWGRGPTALGYSLSWLGFVVFAPVAGWLYDRWGARTVVASGGLVLGLALALTGQVTSLTAYYLCFGVLGAAGTACILIPSTTIVTRWFIVSRGTAMGVLSAGTPAGAVLFYPVNAWLIATMGWRAALVAFGCLVGAATVSLALLYRNPSVDEECLARGSTMHPSRQRSWSSAS